MKRLERYVTKQELSQLMGVSQSTLRTIMNKKHFETLRLRHRYDRNAKLLPPRITNHILQLEGFEVDEEYQEFGGPSQALRDRIEGRMNRLTEGS